MRRGRVRALSAANQRVKNRRNNKIKCSSGAGAVTAGVKVSWMSGDRREEKGERWVITRACSYWSR